MEEIQQIKSDWLEGKPALPVGVTWGVPWKQGVLQRDQPLSASTATGRKIPLQSWTTAYWPDGSVKWTAHAGCLSPEDGTGLQLIPEAPVRPEIGITVHENQTTVEVDTGKILCRFDREGSAIFREIIMEGQPVCTGGKLICLREEKFAEAGLTGSRIEPFESAVARVSVEQQGPVRGVIKVEGRHRSAGGREWLPFTIRLYFYAGLDTIKLVHTFIYDGDAQTDFIKGLGLRFDVPLSGENYHRQVRFAGDSGCFAEAAQFLSRRFSQFAKLYPKQVAGEHLTPKRDAEGNLPDMVQDMAVWDSFQISQDSADHYAVRKRTKPECCWVEAAHGKRNQGLIFAGGETSGFAAALRNSWQKYPTALQVDGLTQPVTALTVWLWSPEANAMDLRHYDTATHTVSSYEGAVELRSTPFGIANTSELNLYCFSGIPFHETLWNCAQIAQTPPLLVCTPEYYHDRKIFGIWSLPDRSTPVKAGLEENLATLIAFYRAEIEERRWYGFWNYGDLMHTYDPVRHCWRYDVGGYAWQNTELAPNLWLWYAFLRSGAPEIFRLSEAMTRHTSEVDLYHIGEYAGLGSRHNVIHWGCGCKEPRIGMAGLHRIYYYLTGDERIGAIMDEVKDADYATVKLDPMRDYFPKDQYPTHARSGPDWSAYCANWLTQWERYEDVYYRDKLLTGIESLLKMPFRLCSGTTFGYDPDTGILHYLGDENYSYHMALCFGATEIWFELAMLLKDPEWEAALAELGEFYNLSPAEKARRTGGRLTGKNWDWPMFSGNIAAFAAVVKRDPELARTAWRVMLDPQISPPGLTEPWRTATISPRGIIRTVQELPWISTNYASMWSLRVIQSLALIGDQLEAAVINEIEKNAIKGSGSDD
jgi:hypothetical protein